TADLEGAGEVPAGVDGGVRGGGLVHGLPAEVVAPAVDRSRGGHGAGVEEAGADARIGRRRLVDGLAVVDERRLPAVDGAGGGEGAAVGVAGGHLGVGGGGLVGGLAVGVVPPAVDSAGGGDGAVVVGAGGERQGALGCALIGGLCLCVVPP